MIALLERWNRWGTATLASGSRRDVVQGLGPFLDTKEVIGLVGPRRAGKSTVLYQIMDMLAERGVLSEQMLHVNFEDPGFALELGTELLDRIWSTFREEVAPEGKAYLFFDEIQVVPSWERWVRARSETENVKIFVTGSSAKLLSRELGTVLTGRHLAFRVHPLSFAEFVRFRGIAAPKGRRAGDPPAMQRAVKEYVRWGGFPEVVLARDERRKELLLKQYFDDVVYRDVALRHEVRNLPSLRSLAVHLLGQSGALVSYQRLGQLLGMSLEQVQTYCGYLQEAMLVDFLPLCSGKAAERTRNPQKVFAVDTGLRNAVCFTMAPDLGRLAETTVHGALLREPNDGLFYWRNGHEVDLVVRRGEQIVRVVQVAYELSRGAPLTEAADAFPRAERLLVVQRRPTGGIEAGPGVAVRSLWQFLMAPGG